MEDHVSQIKERLDVVDVVGGYIKLQKAGVNFKARCPFHNEKTPSFNVSPERQIWHCFGCAKGGDIFSFVQEFEGVDFPEALRILAARAGIQLKQFDPQISNAKTRLYEICELAAKFFEKQLQQSPAGKHALKYLTDRGVAPETVSDFRLGWAHDDWNALSGFLSECGYSEKEIIDAGLAIRREGRRTVYDRFRSRIIFPIQDVNGQVVGFTGRILKLKPDMPADGIEPAKYINTPQTLIYDKSRVLYGLAKSKTVIKQADRCLLVEGNMDALMSFQAGARNVVATSGTALTPEHLKIIKRYTSVLDFCFDADQAGAQATRRGIALAFSRDCRVNIIKIDDPACKDPADYVVKHGEGWVKAAAQSVPALEYYFSKASEGYNPASADSKRSMLAVVGPLINQLTSRIEKAHWISKLAGMMRVPESAVSADLAVVKDDLAVYGYTGEAVKPSVKNVPAEVPTDILSETLLSVVLKKPSLFRTRLAGVQFELLEPKTAGMLKAIADYSGSAEGEITIDGLIAGIGQDYARDAEFAYIRSQETWKELSDAELEAQFDILLTRLQDRFLRAKLTDLRYGILQAQDASNTDTARDLMGEFTRITGKLAEIQKV